MRRVVAKGPTRMKAMFKYFNNFMAAKPKGRVADITTHAHSLGLAVHQVDLNA
ncbi:hypothetical protein OUY22_01175 [Nonomuraea sp. MCN248]|uniref:Uncharacterized protein n=1 Tax=Nonomuraea corallina TaxID=2989783 RepID=A0ABT4S518_9ACTN|nr:hypothetical protein [Nonomuraea corallina]MDA0632010.1 hypothetical protein [Nonomuraea corallina]